MNYALLVVVSLRSKEAPFPLNNPPTTTTLEVACDSALHRMRFIADKLMQILNFHKRAISGLNLETNIYEP